MNKRWTRNLYIFTILFFAFGFFNIIFAWIGFACMIIPFVLLAKDGKKTWCQNYCPRANMFTVLFKGRSFKSKATPKWLTKDKAKGFLLIYFSFNLFILFMSTLMVFRGRMEAMEKVRFMIVFRLPWNMPQLLNISSIPDWAVHLSFRVYSMMFTTTVIGMVLGFMYMPRMWCTICPVNTISDIVIKKIKY
ncbi:4Fe-4S binding protein [Clostridium sp.]|uniref:4Fe-4S binding protein n=1 Tax=Clostridium sp. TaxID=1506 RepID=UPI001A5E1FF8|nr:4Fe-4S binding protein [Clostridium sp.]MBK5235357.1 4Fe-4S binding protein [Clostridium sp.]